LATLVKAQKSKKYADIHIYGIFFFLLIQPSGDIMSQLVGGLYYIAYVGRSLLSSASAPKSDRSIKTSFASYSEILLLSFYC